MGVFDVYRTVNKHELEARIPKLGPKTIWCYHLLVHLNYSLDTKTYPLYCSRQYLKSKMTRLRLKKQQNFQLTL